jgi:DMSO/TMAO reductase YedYZ molybdopterin-dependent catalytic subunit
MGASIYSRRQFISTSAASTVGLFLPTSLLGCASEFHALPPRREFITPTEKFYRMSYAGIQQVDIAKWTLKVHGLVEVPLTLTLSDLKRGPEKEFVRTLSCISNTVGGNLISTARWVGVPLRWVLDVAGLRVGAERVVFRAADGFYSSVELPSALHPETYLVYGMNDESLNDVHGFPLRVLIPNRYGMKQPKWLTEIEVVQRFPDVGYWEIRDWSKEAFVKLTSVIDFPVDKSKIAASLDTVFGYAYCGGKSVQRVEIDLGEGWRSATLETDPAEGVWSFWRIDGLPNKKKFKARVRVIDSQGHEQSGRHWNSYPDGATGYHEVRFERIV